MKLTVFIIAGVLMLVGGGLYIMPYIAPSTRQEPETEMQAVEDPQEQAFGKKIEELLNGLLIEVAGRTRAYKKQRKILADLIKPVNLRTTSYIEENYQMLQTLLPILRAEMDALILVFEHTDVRIRALLADRPAGTREVVLKEWEILKARKAGMYVDFFTIEEDILQNYRDLMEFYYDKRNVLSVDPERNRVLFEAMEDKQREQEIFARLADLSRKQEELLRKK